MLEIFQYDFMVRALIAGVAIGVVAPVIGMFLVVRRFSLMADTLAHVSLVGVAIALVTQSQPIATAIIVAIIAAVGIEYLRGSRGLFGESVLALFLSGSLALATVIISATGGFNTSLLSFLFGSITTVQLFDVYLISIMSALVVVAVVAFYRSFFLVSFDEELARSGGLRARLLSILLTVLAAITVSLAMRIVGVLLIGALVVIPVLAALQFGLSFRNSILLSLLFSVISVILGLFTSFAFDLASGGTIVLITIGIFFLALALARRG